MVISDRTVVRCMGLIALGVVLRHPVLAAGPASDPAIPQASKTTLAVNQFEARGVAADEAATLTDVLRNELSATGKFAVMERGQMEEILKEQGLQQSGACNDQACLVEIGQLLGAQQLVAGSIGKVGKAYSINARVISVQTGQIVSAVSHSYTGPVEGLLTSEMAVVARKLAGLPVKMGERTVIRSRKPLVVGAVACGVAVAGGVAAYLAIRQRGARSGDQTAEVVVTWH